MTETEKLVKKMQEDPAKRSEAFYRYSQTATAADAIDLIYRGNPAVGVLALRKGMDKAYQDMAMDIELWGEDACPWIKSEC